MIVHGRQRELAVSLALREQSGAMAARAPLAGRRALADEVSELIARELIFSELVGAGDLLPSEKELTERYGVSRVTVRAGVRTLKEAGLISIRQGVGAVVLPHSDATRYGLDRLCSFETFVYEAAGELTTEELELEEIAPDEETARRLQIPLGEPICAARRVKSSQGERVAWMIDYVPREVLPLARLRADPEVSVLHMLLAHERLAVDSSDCDIEAVAMPADVAQRLAVENGTVGLLLDEVLYGADSRPLARCICWHRHLPGQPRFSVRRRRRIGD
jgi:DNA-binding GntR family transcriptional regulator